MFTNTNTSKSIKISEDEKRKKPELIFSSRNHPVARVKKSFNERSMMQVLKCFALEDFNTLENYLNLCSKAELEGFFKEKGYAIFDAATLKNNASAINFIIEKIPADLAKIALSAENYKAVRMDLYAETRLEEKGHADEAQKQLRRQFFKAYLLIDRDGVTNLLYGSEQCKEIANLTMSIKEDFKSILESMVDTPKKK